MPVLYFDLNNGTRFHFKIDESDLTVGRAPECEIHIKNAFISKKHARLKLVAPGVYEIFDLGGKNGTYVNGVKIAQGQALRDGDSIHFGGHIQATYQVAEAAYEAKKQAAEQPDATAVKPVVRKLGPEAFEGAGVTSPLDPNEFTNTQAIAPDDAPTGHPDTPSAILAEIIQRANDGVDSRQLIGDLNRLRAVLNEE